MMMWDVFDPAENGSDILMGIIFLNNKIEAEA